MFSKGSQGIYFNAEPFSGYIYIWLSVNVLFQLHDILYINTPLLFIYILSHMMHFPTTLCSNSAYVGLVDNVLISVVRP